MDFIDSLGPAFLAHRLRRVEDLLLDQVGDALAGEGLAVPPRSLSTLLLLDADGPLGPVDLARRLRLSHPLMIRALKILDQLELVEAVDNPADHRRRAVKLTARGRTEVATIRRFQARLSRAIDDAAQEAGSNSDALLALLTRFTDALTTRPVTDRLNSKVAP